ncbi:hypothetical protein GCM10022214_74060 [Actinomadura miaoliensis]|uniref:Uncharacterized protein n=1 Tax=Actinomadura miaoliensis TaxID=430685 RepID=A0ABP7WWS2_9ACTN
MSDAAAVSTVVAHSAAAAGERMRKAAPPLPRTDRRPGGLSLVDVPWMMPSGSPAGTATPDQTS